ncbi:MAG: DUF1990 family protein [Candidatus Krumholzibacteriia bacterium]
MPRIGRKSAVDQLATGLLLAAAGRGPLLLRDYWGVIAGCRATPRELIDILRHRFWELVPPQYAGFRKLPDPEEPLRVGDEMEVHIRGAGTFKVRVVHVHRQSLTVATLPGHPEAGRITFGAYRNPHRDVVFHVRSRARASSRIRYWGYLLGGEPMQTRTWGELISRVAITTGDGVIGFVQATTRTVDEDDGDRRGTGPTFRAAGG